MTVGANQSPIGKLVSGKYRVVRLLAKGGMGVVYEAQHVVVRRRFAIKFLRSDLAQRRDILTRFQREAEAAGALENENVAAAIDFGIAEDGAPYIVMEYLVGESLADLLARQGRLPIARAADLVVQACRGVAAAHAAGIVHRDLKPQNLFVCRRQDGTDLIKVLDFGIAKLQAADDASAATRTGMVLGTAAYMSPEQARGDKVVDNRADVYALGAIFYEVLSLKKPHPGDSQNAILHHIATLPPVPLASIQLDLPSDLVEIVGRALDSNPVARPASVELLAETVAPFARRQVWPGVPEDYAPRIGELSSTMLAGNDRGGASPVASSSSAGISSVGTPDAVASSAATSSADDRVPVFLASTPVVRAPRSRALLVLGGMLVVVVAAVAVTVATTRRSPPPGRGEQTAAPVAPPPPAAPASDSPRALASRRPSGEAQAESIVGRPPGHQGSSGRPAPHSARRRAEVGAPSVGPAPLSPRPEEHRPQGPTFDTENPYR